MKLFYWMKRLEALSATRGSVPASFLICGLLLSCLAYGSLLAQIEGGVVGGKERGPILDEQNRPITAGGFVDEGPVIFEDITRSAGLEAFRHRAGYPEKRYIVGTKSGGIGVFDYDGDGWLDIYLLSASPFGALLGKEEHGASHLFRNEGDGTFTDVTNRAGVQNRQWAFGVVAGDFNNDGRTDFYVSNFGSNRLYQNNGDGTFTDVAAKARVELSDYLTTGATFGDYNRDGLLDLFVCGYAEFDPQAPPKPGIDLPINYCQFRGDDVMCGPRGLPGTRDFLFRNNGDGTFTEVAEAAGVDDKPGYYGFSPAWVDVDDDGWVDLVVANDSTPNYLYINKHDGTFEDISYIAGLALNQDGRAQAGMGLALGDYNLDGLLDIYMAHFSDDYNTLYRNQGDNFFLDVTYEAGLADDTIPFVSWGTAFVDYDNDGLQDLFLANGHVYPAVDNHSWGTSWAQRPLLFKNVGRERFQVVPAVVDSGLAVVVPGRGAGFGDLDNDGRIDVVISCVDSPPKVLRNVAKSDNRWVVFQLVGGEGTPPAGIGATLFLTADGRRQRRDVFTGASFASNSDPRAHFGVGSAKRVEKLEIRWPNGKRQTLLNLPTNEVIEIREMSSKFKVLKLRKGWK